MRHGPAILWITVAALGAGALIPVAARYARARATAESHAATLALVSAQARELVSLRSSAPDWMLRSRPPAGLTTRVSTALSACGLPAAALSNISPEAESSLGEPDLRARRTRAVLTLASLTLPQLGTFLNTWRTREPRWTVSSIELSPQQGSAPTGIAGGDLPVRAVIGLEALFVDEGGTR